MPVIGYKRTLLTVCNSEITNPAILLEKIKSGYYRHIKHVMVLPVSSDFIGG
jgi:hypothetical protein